MGSGFIILPVLMENSSFTTKDSLGWDGEGTGVYRLEDRKWRFVERVRPALIFVEVY